MKVGVFSILQKTAIQNYIQDYLFNNIVFKSVPENLIKYQTDAMLFYYQSGADSYEMELDEFMSSYVGLTLEDLLEQESENNLKTAQFSLIIQAIAEDAGITADVADVAIFFQKQMATDDYSEYEANYGMPYLKQAVLSQKVVDFLTELVSLE
jgi:trigger factor